MINLQEHQNKLNKEKKGSLELQSSIGEQNANKMSVIEVILSEYFYMLGENSLFYNDDF